MKQLKKKLAKKKSTIKSLVKIKPLKKYPRSNQKNNISNDKKDISGESGVSTGQAVVSYNLVAGQKDPALFARLIARGVPKKLAKSKAGYSTNTSTSAILSNKKAICAANTVHEAREILQRKPGSSYMDQAEVLEEIRDNTNTPEAVRVSAIRERNLMQGNHAPQKVEQKNLSLSLVGILGRLDPDDLGYLEANGVDFDT